MIARRVSSVLMRIATDPEMSYEWFRPPQQCTKGLCPLPLLFARVFPGASAMLGHTTLFGGLKKLHV